MGDKPMLMALVCMLIIILFYEKHDDPYSKYPAMEWIGLLAHFVQVMLTIFWFCSYYIVEAPLLAVPNRPRKTRPAFELSYADKAKPVFAQTLPPMPQPAAPETREEFVQRHFTYLRFSSIPFFFLCVSLLSLCGGPNARFWLFLWGFGYLRLSWGQWILLPIIHAGESLANMVYSAALLVTLLVAISFWIFYDDIGSFSRDKNGGVNNCETIYQCFLVGLNYGLRSDLKQALGPGFTTGHRAMPLHAWEGLNHTFLWFVMLVWKNVWHFLYCAVGKAIITSTFGGLRAADAALTKDAKERCLVCSCPRFQVDEDGGGFSKHVTEHHNPWSYLALLCHLKLSDPDEFSGIETEVADKAQYGDPTFLPVKMCTELQKVDRHRKQIREKQKHADDSKSSEEVQFEQDVMGKLNAICTALDEPSVSLSLVNKRLGMMQMKMSKFIDVSHALIKSKGGKVPEEEEPAEEEEEEEEPAKEEESKQEESSDEELVDARRK